MKLDDLKNDWQQAITSDEAPDNLTEVISMLEKETSKIDKEIKRRDIVEIAIALLLIPVWIYGLLNSASTIQTIGCWIAIASGLYIPYKLMSAKKVTSTTNDSIKEFLLNEKQKLSQQKQLLESIVWWYIAPITAAILLITLGANVDESGIPQISEQMTTYYGFVALLIVGIYFLNKRAAKKKFGPLLDKVEQRLAELAS